MKDRQQTLSTLPLLISLCFLSLAMQTYCLIEEPRYLPSVTSLTYGSMTAVCIASRYHYELTTLEFSVLSAAPLLFLANFGALITIASIFIGSTLN
jgi:hypothetical protein